MSSFTDAVRRHHKQLANVLAEHVASATAAGPKSGAPLAFAAFLKNELIPHANGEERHLYPRVDFLLHEYGRATETMSVDHEFLADYVDRIEKTATALEGASGERSRELESELRRLALGIEAILKLHLEKEERVYLPLVEKHLPETEQDAILDEMHSEGAAHREEQTRRGHEVLDVRSLAPRDRHAVIFSTFAGLAPSQSFVLVNDHDPKPLFYQFQAEHTRQFSWDYLEQGPEVWRVRIGRV